MIIEKTRDGFRVLKQASFALNFDIRENILSIRADDTAKGRRVFYADNSRVVIAENWSEITSAVGEEKLRLSSRSLALLLRCGFVPAPMTVYENVFQLTIGHEATILNTRLEPAFKFNYPYTLEQPENASGWSDNQFKDLLADSIARRTRGSDAALLLSSGKDSMGLLSAIKHAGIKNITCLTYDTAIRENESLIASRAAKDAGLQHIVVRANADEEFNRLSELMSSVPHPTFDCALPSVLECARQGREHGELLLDGLGNDKYMFVSPSPRERALVKLAAGKRIPALWARTPPPVGQTHLDYLGQSLTMVPVERWFFGTRLNRQWLQLLGLDWRGAQIELSRLDSEINNHDPFLASTVAKACYSDFSSAMEKTRISAEHHKMEPCFPFCDDAVIDYYKGISSELKFSRRNRRGKIAYSEWVGRAAYQSEYYNIKGSFRYDLSHFVARNHSRIRSVILKHIDNEHAAWLNRSINVASKNFVIASQIYIALLYCLWMDARPAKQLLNLHQSR